jgi:hypothetical protein
MGSAIVGIVGVVIAAVFWGSNFIVCKGYDLPNDGMHFVLLMSTGILFVGILAAFASAMEDGDFEVVLAPDGLLGGMIWTLGNFLTVPIIENIGLGMGLAIWCGVNLIVAFIVGAVGMGSLLDKESIANPAMGGCGIVLAALALVLFSQVKPSLDTEDDEENMKDLLAEESGGAGKETKVRNIPLGLGMAAAAGVCYGFQVRCSPLVSPKVHLFLCSSQFVPLSIWNNKIKDQGHIFDHVKPSDTIQSLRFLFSQFAGIYLTSLVGFTIYSIRKGNKPLLGAYAHAPYPSRTLDYKLTPAIPALLLSSQSPPRQSFPPSAAASCGPSVVLVAFLPPRALATLWAFLWCSTCHSS